MSQDRILAVPVVVWIAFFLCADLMLAFPEVDLRVSGWFFTPGVGFEANGVWWERFIYHSVEYLVVGVSLGLIGLWLYNRYRRRALMRLDGRRLSLLLALLLVVPGLFVNQGLKEHLGRARPVQLREFGGDKQFTPAFVPSDQGGGSFSSGHAVTGFWLVAVAYTLSNRFGLWAVITLVYALVLAVVRIASGGHFLSDVVSSGLFMLIGWFLLHALICRRAETPSSADAVTVPKPGRTPGAGQGTDPQGMSSGSSGRRGP